MISFYLELIFLCKTIFFCCCFCSLYYFTCSYLSLSLIISPSTFLFIFKPYVFLTVVKWVAYDDSFLMIQTLTILILFNTLIENPLPYSQWFWFFLPCRSHPFLFTLLFSFPKYSLKNLPSIMALSTNVLMEKVADEKKELKGRIVKTSMILIIWIIFFEVLFYSVVSSIAFI